METLETCALCERELGMPYDEHHLVPKSKGGNETVKLHRICHSKIHSVFTHTELKQKYDQINKLKKHPEIKKFISWVLTKPPTFYKRTRSKRKFRNKKTKLFLKFK